jgi:hypothetical protein
LACGYICNASGVSPLILVAYFLDILVDLKIANQCLSWGKKMLGAYGEATEELLALKES